MKPTVPETGTIIRHDGGNAVIMLEGGKSCKGCGAAEIGLCRAGGSSTFLTAQNAAGAEVGDTVVIGLDRTIQRRGYLLAYGIPLFFFIAGAAAGHLLGAHLAIPSLEAVTAFASLAVSSFFSLERLKKLNSTSRMTVRKILSDNAFTGEIKSEEERWYLKYMGLS